MTVMTNVVLVLKDSEGNIGIVKPLTDNDIIKIANAITDVGQVVDPATHMPIEATTASVGVVQLATAQDITNGTANKVVDAKELNNFAQTLPAANGVTDVSSGDNSNQLVVSRIGGSKTLTIDNVEHADNADEATHAAQADTATSANSVAWNNVSGKPTKVSQFTNDSGYITGITKAMVTNALGYTPPTTNTTYNFAGATFYSGNSDNAEHDANNAVKNGNYYYYSNGPATSLGASTDDGALYVQAYSDAWVAQIAQDYRNGRLFVRGKKDNIWQAWNAVIDSSTIGSQSVNYANSAGYVQGNNNSANAANALLRSGSGRTDSSPEGDTWIFWDELGGSDAPWGFKHNQLANTIGFYAAGTETSSINLSNGYFSGSAENSNYTYWLRTSSHHDHIVHTEWDGGYFWTYVTAPDGGYRAVRVERANSSGWADSAGSVAWGNVSGRPDIWIG